MNPRFPLYIVSKGRWESRITASHLERMRVPFFVVVEEQELGAYASVIDRRRLLILDPAYQEEYETCDDLGDSRSKGPGPARNFAWDHAINLGADWHWVMDDNINGFYRLNRNLKTPVSDGTIFRCMEDWVLRYDNVAMGGPNYFMFASRKTTMPPFVLNTRIYSCNLIKNAAPFRWRGRYNEDTDLSVRMLKAGLVTVQFNAFLQYKLPTQTVKGGNTEAFYHAEGELVAGERYAIGGTDAKSQMQVDLHPDISRLTVRFGRVHHYVDYSGFKENKLRFREGYEKRPGVNNYGMELFEFEDSDAARSWDEARYRIFGPEYIEIEADKPEPIAQEIPW